jgi:hypothetical protein
MRDRAPSGRSICWVPIWHEAHVGEGFEHLLLSELSADSTILSFDEQGDPFRLTYHLRWDAQWRLRDARLVRTSASGVATLHLDSDGEGSWRDGAGTHIAALAGCIDIDIWPTPFTNTFPIRRAGLRPNARQEFDMAYIDVGSGLGSGVDFRPMRQAYTRLGPSLYRYESLDGSHFTADLLVDDEALVLEYQNLFRRAR